MDLILIQNYVIMQSKWISFTEESINKCIQTNYMYLVSEGGVDAVYHHPLSFCFGQQFSNSSDVRQDTGNCHRDSTETWKGIALATFSY